MPGHLLACLRMLCSSPWSVLAASNSRLRCTHWLLLPRRVKAAVLPAVALPVAHLASAGMVATASSSASRAAGKNCEYAILLSMLPEWSKLDGYWLLAPLACLYRRWAGGKRAGSVHGTCGARYALEGWRCCSCAASEASAGTEEYAARRAETEGEAHPACF